MNLIVRGWRMVGPGKIEAFEEQASAPKAGNVLVKVAGCGVCHTDLGFLYGGVPTRKKGPVALGHEISGVVVQAGAGAEGWVAKRVLVPAVAPCGTCRFCQAGRPTACRAGTMPGNDQDGGFASHVEVPAHGLCAIDSAPEQAPVGVAKLPLWQLAVVADAVTTPLQAIRRSNLSSGDLAVVVGTGGVGIHAVQLAKVAGAHVAAVDVDPAKLERAQKLGAGLVIDARTPFKELRTAISRFAEQAGANPEGWRVYETSGTKPGQELAFSLVNRGGSLSVVGFTPEPVSVRLSNLMALDATAYGNWGCDPALYPAALELAASGKIELSQLVRREPLSEAPRVLEEAHHGRFTERVVLVP